MVRFLFTTVTDSCSASGLLLSCFIMLRFRFTTVTGPLHVYYMSCWYPIQKSLFINKYLLFFSSLLLCYFFVWYSHIELARFVIVYHSCVPIHKTKRSMSRLTNPITPTDVLIAEICLSYFHNFFTIFFGSIHICVSTTSKHISFPLLIHTHWTHMYRYIRMYVSWCTCTYSVWYVYTCTHMCTCSYLCCICMYICVQISICMYTYVYIDTYQRTINTAQQKYWFDMSGEKTRAHHKIPRQ